MRRFSVLFIVIFSLLAYFIISPHGSTSADGTYADISTTDSADAGADAINFSQGRVWTIDQYGKYIWLTEDRATVHHWAFSNNSGATWSQGSEAYQWLVRGSVAYDSINDKLHVIWTTGACDSNGGIIYRRYAITRDGSNNITDITRDDAANINLQLDYTGDVVCGHPVALWVNDGSADGILVAIWNKTAANQNEVRGSMRKLTLTAADGNAANWTALDGSADTFSINAPAVAADKIFSANTYLNAPTAAVRGGTGSRKDDFYVFVAETASNQLSAYQAVWNSTNGDWSGGWQSPVVVGQMSSSGGYSNKFELLTRPVLDSTNDRLYISWARWKDDTAGDTVSLAYLDSSDNPSSTIDIYSANGTHAYAPTMDIAYDSTLDLLYVAYVESTTNGTNGSISYKTYNGTTLSSATRFYTNETGTGGQDGGADIPILYDNRSNNRLLFAFRVNGAVPPTAENPHHLYWGYVTLPDPTPTPSPTATPTATPTLTPTTAPAAASSSPLSPVSTDPPGCTDTTPSFIPNLFQIDAAGTSTKLFFTTAPNRQPITVIEFPGLS